MCRDRAQHEELQPRVLRENGERGPHGEREAQSHRHKHSQQLQHSRIHADLKIGEEGEAIGDDGRRRRRRRLLKWLVVFFKVFLSADRRPRVPFETLIHGSERLSYRTEGSANNT